MKGHKYECVWAHHASATLAVTVITGGLVASAHLKCTTSLRKCFCIKNDHSRAVKQAGHTCPCMIVLWYFIQNSHPYRLILCKITKAFGLWDSEALVERLSWVITIFLFKESNWNPIDLCSAEPSLSVISWYVGKVCSAVSIGKYWYTTPLYWRPDSRCNTT